MGKTKVVIKMYFTKQFFLQFFGESREVTYSFRKMLEKFF